MKALLLKAGYSETEGSASLNHCARALVVPWLADDRS